MESKIKLLIALLLLSLISLKAQSELRIGFLTSKPIKGNYGLHIEYAYPVGKFFEITPSLFAMQRLTIRTIYPFCSVGEPFLVSKQRFALRQSINDHALMLAMLGVSLKPLAKVSQKHDLGMGIYVAYAMIKGKSIAKVETEEGKFVETKQENFENGGGGLLIHIRYAYRISNHSALGVRYINEVTFDSPIGIWSLYYGFRF